MCGIAIILSPKGVSTSTLGKMCSVIRHRGTDGEGYMIGRPWGVECYSGQDTLPAVSLPLLPDDNFVADAIIAFGHRRLAIVDVSASGHQPMAYADQRFWISYNGEIFNFVEIRAELVMLGHVFRSSSDTEVVLAAYQQWGSECLRRFNGMWALAIWDRLRGTLFVARDRFGVKPLYYWVGPDSSVYFVSEIKQLMELPAWRARVNSQRAYDYLAWGLSDHTDETLFSGVFQMPPGCCVTLDVATYRGQAGAKLPIKRWYDLQPQDFAGSFEDAAREFGRLLEDAVSLRLRADVPVGSCLSGGLDSSSIVCLSNNLLRKKRGEGLQKTFSACALDPRFDERRWVDLVVEATKVDAHYCYPSIEGLISDLLRIVWHQDEPFGSTSVFAQWTVFKLAAENGVKVMLDGQGADEQLAGYYSYFGPRFAGLLKRGRLSNLLREIAAVRRIHGRSELRSLFGMLQVLLPESAGAWMRGIAGGGSSSPCWLSLSRLGAVPRDPNIAMGVYTDSVQALSLAQLTGANLQMLLHWEDRNSMAHGIESRVPYLDYRLVEFVLGLPEEFKLALGVTKRVQRAALKGVLPEEIRNRMDKLGFVTPEAVWVREHAPDVFRRLVEKAQASSLGVLNENASLVLEEIIAGRRGFDFSVWRMVSFGEWMDRFSVEI